MKQTYSQEPTGHQTQGLFALPLAGYCAVMLGLAFLFAGLHELSILPRLGWLAAAQTVSGLLMIAFVLLAATAATVWLIGRVARQAVSLRIPRTHAIFCGGMFLLSVLLTMIPTFIVASMKASGAAAQVAPWQTVDIPNSNLTLQIPEGFEPNPSLVDASSAAGWTKWPTQQSIIVGLLPKIDTEFASVEEFGTTIGEVLVEQLDSASVTATALISMQGRPAHRQTIEALDESLRFVLTVEIQAYDEYFVDLRYISPPSRLAEWNPTIESISQSIALAN